MTYTIQDIAQALDAEIFGDETLPIERLSEPAQAGPDDLALAMSEKFRDDLGKGQARAAVLWPGADWQALGLEAALIVPRPRFAMASLTQQFDRGPDLPDGIHASAIIDPDVQIAEDARIGPFVTIGRGAKIGPGARISARCSIAEDVQIGAECLLYEGVTIRARVVIGDRFIAQPGGVIGSDGFSFVTPEKSNAETARETLGGEIDTKSQSWTRIYSLGSVIIGDDVELGSNSTIDAGTIRPTRIGNGTKLDNLVHVGHNVEIGEDCLLCGMVGIAGSVRIGNRVVLGGQVGVGDNLFIGDDVVAGGGTKILSNAPAGRALLGYPAIKMDAHIEMQKAIRRLPRFMQAMKSKT
ncbi:MAG: UDP-3-O-(3-hydroxymyristoyl)glucosamine N-acyltransferase [Pseudomonadota bacterium]